MGIAVLSLIGVFVSLYLTLHRVGLIGSLACGVDGGCSTVQTSSYATFLGIPVPFLGLGGYLVLFLLSLRTASGVHDERRTAIALLLLAAGAFAFSMYLTALEAFVIHAWCRWCVVSAIIATLIFLCSLPEAARLRRESIEQ